MDKYLFQYCQKIVVFSEDHTKVLLAQRKGEADMDGVYSFIGGKMEVTDKDYIVGMQREKNEEAGKDFKIKVYPKMCTMCSFIKKSGHHMLAPCFYAVYVEGEIDLNEEYSAYKWQEIAEFDAFEPKVPDNPDIVRELLKLKKVIKEEELILM